MKLQKKYMFTVAGTILMFIMILWKFFIPNPISMLKNELEDWIGNKHHYSQGALQFQNIRLDWAYYTDGKNALMDFLIEQEQQTWEGTYYKTPEKQWLRLSPFDLYILLGISNPEDKEFSVYQLLQQNLLPDRKNIILKQERQGRTYQWSLDQEVLQDKLTEMIEQIDDPFLIELFIQSQLINKKIVASEKNIEEGKENLLDFSIENMRIEIVTSQNEEISLYMELIGNQQKIEYRERTSIFRQAIHIPEVSNDQMIPIQEFLLFR